MLVLCLMTTLLGAQQITTHASAQDAERWSAARQAEVSQGMAREIRAVSRPLESPVAAAYVQSIGETLAASLPGPKPPFRFELIRGSGGGHTQEPFSLMDGTIFAPSCLLLAAQSETEFAGMLAHAMAHVASWQARDRSEPVLVGPLGLGPAEDGMMPLGLRAAQRGREREADLLAVRMLAQAGFDPRGLLSYLDRVQREPESGPAPPVLPPRAERFAAIEAAVTELQPAAYRSSDRFTEMQEEVRRLTAPPPPPSLKRSGDPR